MSALLEVLLASKVMITLVAGGIVVAFAAMILAHTLHRSTLRDVERLLDLVAEGQTAEARVEARKAGSDLKPFVEALKGDPTPPLGRPIFKEVLLALFAVFPAIALPLYGIRTLKSAPSLDVIPLTSTLMLGVALLLPASAIACVAIVHLGVRTSRAVRGACVSLLAEQVRLTFLKERSPEGTGPIAAPREDAE